MASAAFQSPAGGAATLSKAPAALGGEESSAGLNPAALELGRQVTFIREVL
jgi:hypothetical protein